ncbi:restriction endonuclease subunit S [Parabacteroides sp. OttesenSCG-928-G07]|nr:restriction endonuclease subunit S [Parabacteroides sp. OttesenSCG-928-G07]
MSKGWKMVKLGQIAKINMGQSPDSSTYNATGIGIPFYQGNADFGELYPKVRLYCCKPTKYANNNDILMSVRAPVGALNISKEHCCIGRGLTAITAIEGVSFFKYLYYNLKYQSKYIQSLGVGSTFKAISAKEIQNLYIPFPLISNQVQIAATLDKASELIALRKKQLKELDALAESVFYDMFGDPVKNERGWKTEPVINHCSCIVPGRDKPKSFTGDTPWITTAELNHLGYTFNSNTGLTKEEIQTVRAKIIPKGCVIITCVGDLGIASIAGNDMVINQQLHAFLCSRNLNNMFLAYNLSLRRDYMYKMASTTTVPYMNKSVCNSIPILLPPIKLQTRFAAIIEKIEQQKSLARKALQESEDLFQRLMQDLFKPD